MKIDWRPHDRWMQEFATSCSRQRLLRLTRAVQDAAEDSDRTARRAAGECKLCWYVDTSRIGGSAMTTWFCGLCGTEAVHGSTAVPKLCRTCGATHSLCVQCGGDYELRAHRRKWPTPITTLPADTSHAD